jgi:hypothetical protein
VTVLAVLGWVALLIALALVPRLLVDALVYPERITAWAGGHWPRKHRAQAVGPPVEQLAVELRRLAGVLLDPRPVSSVRRFGVERAYDETLGKACCALGIEHHLDEVRLSDREFERLRVEAALQDAGLVLRGPACGCPRPERRPD